MYMIFTVRRFWKDACGATAIEMAFAVPLFVAFLIGFIGLSHAFWVYNSLEYALDHGGRYTMMTPSATSTQIRDTIRANVHGIDSSTVNVSIDTDTSGTIDMKTITVSYNYNFMNNLASFFPSTLTAETTVPVIPD